MIKIKDQIGNLLEFKRTPTRIISLVPSITELLVDLGLEENIVGITKFCIHPTYLKKSKTIVGGTKTINLEKIKKLKPDIILCNKEENTKEIVKFCEQVTQTYVSDIYTITDTLEVIKHYGNIFSLEKEAKVLIEKINFLLIDFTKFIKLKNKKKVAYFIWKNPWMVAGNNTFINNLLQLNKFKNIFGNNERYPQVEIDKLPEVDSIFLSSEPYPFKEKHIKELKEKYPKSEILLVDGEMFSWYGSRLLKAFDYFKTLH